MRRYFKVMLGAGSCHAEECVRDGFIGADFGADEDLSSRLTEEYRDFNRDFIPRFLAENPDKTNGAAGFAGGQLWTVAKGIGAGDIVISPTGAGLCAVGTVNGQYVYAPGEILPHRRSVRWVARDINRANLSKELRASMGYGGTVCELTRHADEIEALSGIHEGTETAESVEGSASAGAFAMEKYLEEFLVSNWEKTEIGAKYDLFAVDGEIVGRQYQTDTGPLDLLAVSKDGARLLVIELKRGRASDPVVGQILRYMSFIQEVVAEPGQTVEGAVIAYEDDPNIRRALQMMPEVRFYRYRVSFSLEAG